MKLSKKQAELLINKLKFRRGLITAIICDYKTKEVLMVAQQNKEAVLRSLTDGRIYFWSRERKKLWLKGEQSGHFQFLVKARIDCDGDVILYFVKQIGGACHKGYRSCFHTEITCKGTKIVSRKIFDPDKVYKS